VATKKEEILLKYPKYCLKKACLPPPPKPKKKKEKEKKTPQN
jgi:hypothetical protein